MLPRNNSKRNPLSKPLSNFIKNNNLDLVDVTNGNGPTVTYQHPTLINSSYIDHIGLRADSGIPLLYCKVHDISETNTSDHTPVSVTHQLQRSLHSIIEEDLPNAFIPKWYWKNNSFIMNYKLAVDNHIMNLPNDNSDTSLLNFLQILTDSAAEAAERTFEHNKSKKYSKQWWSSELSNAKIILSSTHFNNWKAAGFPRDNGSLHNRYLLARKNFRKQVKYAQKKNIIKKYMNIDKLRNTHPQNFWNKMRNLKKEGTSKKYTINGKQSNEDISNEFADHSNTLLNHARIRGKHHCLINGT